MDHAVAQRRTLPTLMTGVVLSGAAMAGAYATAAVLADDITGSDTWAGLAAACLTIGSALASVPLSRYMGRHGRRPGLRAAWSIAAVGGGAAFLAAILDLYPLLVVGILCIGVGNSGNLAARFAAADLAPEDQRARSIGLLVWATTIGSVLGPTVALGWAGSAAEAVGLPELSGPYLLSLGLFGTAAVFIERRLRPDPLVLAGGLTPDGGPSAWQTIGPTFRRIFRSPSARLAVVAMIIGHAVMVSVMTMTPLHMKDGEHELRIIGFVISLHIVGMYAFSPAVGWLVDVIGPRPVIVIGGLQLFVGAELASHTDPEDSLGVYSGLFLIGLGWSFGLIAGSSLLTGAFPVADRVTIQGAADLAMTGAGAAAGVAAGFIVSATSYHDFSHNAGLTGAALSLVVLATSASRTLTARSAP